jgi:hypothetical protein
MAPREVRAVTLFWWRFARKKAVRAANQTCADAML